MAFGANIRNMVCNFKLLTTKKQNQPQSRELKNIWQSLGYNFLPELGIERNLGLTQKLKNRIQETTGSTASALFLVTVLLGRFNR